MVQHPLTQGHVALIDEEDAERVSKYSWFAVQNNGKVYAYAYVNGKRVNMARFILNAKPRARIVHIDGNSLNNQRANLKMSTKSVGKPRIISRPKAVPVRGLHGVWTSESGRGYDAKMNIEGKLVYVAYHCKTPSEAAMAYDEAVVRYSKKVCGFRLPLNFPEKTQPANW